MVIVFFGTPRFAVPTLERLLASRHTVAGVVTQPDRPRGRGHRVTAGPVKALAMSRQLPVLQPDRLKLPAFADALSAWQPDLAVVAAYGRIIPAHLLVIPRLGMINVHASLLPKYRGAAPVHRAVIAGERETGVTIMRVAEELDAGAMFAKATRPIGPDETSDVVEESLAHIGADLLVGVVERISAGIASEEPQDASQATYAPRLTKEEGLIDWSQRASSIHNRVRGLSPWPHTYTYLGGARLIVLRSQIAPEMSGPDRAPTTVPGTIVDVTPSAIVVATGGGQLAIVELQGEGGRPLRVRDFIAGHPIHRGAVFAAR
jgi:methionyl-tRNA formyltransferase